MTDEFVPNTTVVPGEDVYKNIVTEDATLGKDGLYHTKTDGVSLRNDYLQQELNDYTPNNTKLDTLKVRLAAEKEYLLGTASKQGLVDLIQEVKIELEERSKLLDPEILREIDDEFKRLENELASLEREREGIIARITAIQGNINFIEEANNRHNEKNKEITRDFYDDEINKLKEIIAEKEKVQREINKLEKESYETSRVDEFGMTTDKVKIANALADKRQELEILERKERELKMSLRRVGLNAFEELKPKQEVPSKVTVKFNTNGVVEDTSLYKPIQVNKGDVIIAPQDPVLLNSNGMNQVMQFDKWMLNGEEFDFTKPVTEDITLDASYKRLDLHPVTYYDDKGEFKFTDRVRHGDTISNQRTLEDRRTKVFDKWVLENGEEFDFTQPVTGPVVLYAKYKRDWKKIAAIGAGVATGALTLGADMLLGTGGLISSATTVGLGLSSLATDYKLKNNKPKIETQYLNGIKKAEANVVNFFRDNRNLKNITTFLRTATISTLVTGIGMRVSDALQTAAIPETEPIVDAGISR